MSVWAQSHYVQPAAYKDRLSVCLSVCPSACRAEGWIWLWFSALRTVPTDADGLLLSKSTFLLSSVYSPLSVTVEQDFFFIRRRAAEAVNVISLADDEENGRTDNKRSFLCEICCQICSPPASHSFGFISSVPLPASQPASQDEGRPAGSSST